MDIGKYEVPVDKLRWQCDPAIFDFDCTKDIEPLREFIGQERAIRALEFGLSISHDGYNIYVAGLTGTGKTSAVKTQITKILKEEKILDGNRRLYDWCYLYNFEDADHPASIKLPKGRGKTFREQVNSLLQRLKEDLAKAFSSEEYIAERKKVIEKIQTEQQKLFSELEEEARKRGFLIQTSPTGPILIPVVNGKPISQEDYLALDDKERKKLETAGTELRKKLQATTEKAQDEGRQIAEKIRDEDKKIADYTVSRLFAKLIDEYKESEQISDYLNSLQSYTLDNTEVFKKVEEKTTDIMEMVSIGRRGGRDPFLPFEVNVFIDNSNTRGRPVIIEPNPNYVNLFGRIERQFLMGAYFSDHTMLKPGSLHKANGGYLLLNAIDVLSNPAVWPTLKRTIKNKELCIEDPGEQFGLYIPQGIRPQPIPLNVKVLLIGDNRIYQLLSIYDEDFWEIFKVKADFNFEIDRTMNNMLSFAAFIAGFCQKNKICHFDKSAVAKVLEFASRTVDDQEKLTSRFAGIQELLEESAYWAQKDKAEMVSERHVLQAVEERRFRHNLPDERIKEMIDNGTIMIDLDGAVVGQINGLSIYSLGDITFGKPSRITCKTFLGRQGVINIERESELSGKIHDKGVLILNGYIGWKYAQDHPLSLSASLCFEQSYQGVDGDSASSAEIYALLSSLSEVPIKQNLAVTGSVNQKGEIQPIGGVNQKIEGFFQVCKDRGLTGEQGVIIPHKNLRNLMLRDEVVEAIKERQFHIYAVNSIDEGIEVITGVRAGQKKQDGNYPRNSLNYKVEHKLEEMATRLQKFQSPADNQNVKKKSRK
jgi:lon-related putative ATP-dependent protease